MGTPSCLLSAFAAKDRPVWPTLMVVALTGLLPCAAWASSSVYVTNNTPKVLKFQVTSELPGEYWSPKSTAIPAFSRKRILETSRGAGVTDGESFIFTATVHPQDPKTGASIEQFAEPFAIRLRLDGRTLGSHMWQSVKLQTGMQSTWHDDRQKYSASMTIQGQPWDVTYWAYYTGGDDDVEYVFREDYPLPTGFGQSQTHDWKVSHLNVLSYNVYLRPTSLFVNGQAIRARLIPPRIPGYDVVVFQEAFDDDARATLLAGMAANGYPHHTAILGSDRGAEQDGGVVIASRWPIVLQRQQLFGDTCSGSDCMADKGVLYAKIDKQVKAGEHNYFHIFGTHLNDGDWGVQTQQLQMIRAFIDAQPIPATEGVVIAGDFNIDRGNAGDYQVMLDTLGTGWFSGDALRGHPWSFDGPLNDLGDGSRSNYDYVLYSTGHRPITSASFAEVRVPRALTEWKELETETARWDLSDHYAVYGSLHFVFDPLADWDPGVDPSAPVIDYRCNVDSDCPAGLICLEGAQPRPGARVMPPPGGSGQANSPSNSARMPPSTRTRVPVQQLTSPREQPESDAQKAREITRPEVASTRKRPDSISSTQPRYKGLCRVEPPN